LCTENERVLAYKFCPHDAAKNEMKLKVFRERKHQQLFVPTELEKAWAAHSMSLITLASSK
jgi:hypothetical protein